MNKYVFRPYSKKYTKIYINEHDRLTKILGNVVIEHIGSTAVPGLGGKGIIDIIIAVTRSDMKKASKNLQKNGYDFKESGGTKNRLFHQKDHDDGRVHVHIVATNGKDFRNTVALRDYLKNHKEDVKKYTEIKKKAAKICHGDKEIYREHKKRFLERLTEKAIKTYE
jgi:GrpB-like predicted nucleotidyltransferase (UPF0157 family)